MEGGVIMQELKEKLINELNKHAFSKDETAGYTDKEALKIIEARNRAIECAIKAVNEVTKEYTNSFIGRWIPVSERLPKDRMESCLVTLKNGAVFQAKYVINGFKMICSHGTEPFYENNPVIAWAPMPQGYVPEEREDT